MNVRRAAPDMLGFGQSYDPLNGLIDRFIRSNLTPEPFKKPLTMLVPGPMTLLSSK